MSQGWNRQFQNVQRLINEYANAMNLRDQGFQLGESGDLHRPGNFTLGETGSMKTGKTVPTVYQQPRVQPQAALPGRNTISLPASQKPLFLTTSGKPLPNQQAVINLGGDAGQVAYKLPNGTYTSNKDLANIAKQQTARAQFMRDTRNLTKGAKVGGLTAAVSVPTAILTHRKAIDYYNSILNDPNSSPEQKQLAMAMRTKEQIQMGTEGLGTAIGTGLGTLATKHPKIGSAVGGIIPNALSQGVGWAFDTGLTPAMQQYKFQPYNGSLINEVGYMLGSLGKGGKGKSSDNNGGKGSSTNTGGKGMRGTGGQPTTQAQALALAQQLAGTAPIDAQQEADAQQANMDAINDYVSKLQEINRPYIDALQNYSDRYDDLVKNNFNAQRYFTAMAGLTGNNNYARLADSINPLVTEAAKIDLQKKIQDAQAGDLNAINEIMGNLAMAEEMGLPPEAAFANKNLLTAMTMRDRNLTNREIAQLNNAAKLQIALQNAQNRLAVQNLRNQGGMTNALIYAGQYRQPAVGLNQQGTASNVPASYDAMLQAAHNKNNR